MHKILIIDDDHDLCALLQRFLSRKGYAVETAHSGKAGIKTASEQLPDLVLTDFRLGDMEGYEVIQQLLAERPYLPVLVMTGYSDIRTAVNVIRHGALDYIAKPIVPDEILLSIRTALEKVSRPAQNLPEAVVPDAHKNYKTSKHAEREQTFIIGQSASARLLYQQIDLVAPTNFTVIVYGESGSGKESVARLIHERSKRSHKPFVSMDCGAISKDLAQSELFGHEKGAFTGALNAKIGHFEMADGGTLFFDEIINLPYDVQVALLRVVQERKVKRIGSTREIPIDVRIVVASNERLPNACRKGKFREDLYHRFNEFSIELPPLRERIEDILPFAQRFLQETAGELNRPIRGFSPEVEQVLLHYPWYGNVRELKNIIKRATLLTDGPLVQVQALPFELVYFQRLSLEATEDAPETNILPPRETAPAEPQPVAQAFEPKPPNAIPQHTDLKSAAQNAEYQRIIEALQQSRYNKSKAAALLGVDRKTLYNKLKAYNIT